MSLLRRYWPVIFLALLPLIPLWRCIFLGETPGPFDQIRQMAPWHGPKPAQPWDVLQADGVLQFYPWRDMVFKAWGQGQLPLWNPYELGGTPLLANSQSAGFYPPHIALGILHVPTPLAMTFLAWFHLFWAGLGVYMLSRRLGASKLGGAVAGASFQLSAFMLAWTALPSVITTVSWIPWLLVGIHRIFTANSGLRAVATTALASGMMILAGHLQFVAYGFMAAVFMGVWLAVSTWRQSPRPFLGPVRFFIAMGLGVALAAPQLLPVLDYSQFSHRRTSPDATGYQAYLEGSIKPFELATLAVPTSLGDPRRSVELEAGISLSSYWPPLAKRGANFAESAVTIGPLILGLLFLVHWRDRKLWPVAAIGIIALLLALGTVLNWPLYFLVPGWSSTGSPGRIIVLFLLAASVLAGTAIREERASAKSAAAAIAASLILTILCTYGLPGLAPASIAGMDVISIVQLGASSMVETAFIGSVVVGLLGMILLLPQARKYRPALVIVPVLLMLVGSAHNLLTSGQAIPIEKPKSFDRVAFINNDWSLIAAVPAYAPPNTGYLLGTHELAGYDSLLHRDTKKLLDDINGASSAPPANGNMMLIKPSADRAKLADAGVSRVISAASPGEELGGTGRVSPNGKISEESFSKLAVQASGPSKLIVRDRNMPGWLAKIDGKHVPLSESSLWREVDLPPGEHTVEFNYVPPGMMLGIFLGVPAWLLLAALAFWPVKRTRQG